MFIVFTAAALWMLRETGADVDLGGAMHGIAPSHAAAASVAAAAAASAASSSR